MHNSCQCLRRLRPLSHHLLSRGSAGYIKRLYASENPKWTAQAEEQFVELFKLKEKPPPPPRDQSTEVSQPAKAPQEQPARTKPSILPPPIHPETPVRKSSIVLPALPPLPPIAERPMPAHSPVRPVQQSTQMPARRFNAVPLATANPITSRYTDSVPQVPNIGELYASSVRMLPSEARPTKPFEKLEADERAPQLTDERESVIKLWIEGLPITDQAVVAEGLRLLAEHPIKLSELEVVTDRGMIATKSAFLTVDFGENNREKIFYQLENFGLTIKGMRCPVRTAEVKRSLTLIELGQISEVALVAALKEHDIQYATYDYPGRYNSPQRQIAFPYRGSVILTFRSHDEAYETKRRFDSMEGITVGDKRIFALWGPRAGSAPLEVRTAANYMRNLIWENRDLRKYVTMVRQQNTKIDEPKDFNDLTKTLESQQMRQLDRERKLDEIRRQLEETKQALIAARSGSARGETTEEIKNAEAAMALAKELESELQTEGIKDTMQNKSVLTLSPHVSKVESTDGFSKVSESYEAKFTSLKERHSLELKKLKAEFDIQRKTFTREVYSKNHRNAGMTAEELGVRKATIQRDTKYRSSNKKRKTRVVARKLTPSEDSESPEGSASSETSEGSEGAVAEGETEGVAASETGGEVESTAEETESTEAEREQTRRTEDSEETQQGRHETENMETEGEEDTEVRGAKDKSEADSKDFEMRGTESEITETQEASSEEMATKSTTRTPKKLERIETGETTVVGDTTIVVDSTGKERIAKVVDWK